MTARDGCGAATFLIGASGKIMTWNAACEAALGHAECDVVRQSALRFVAADSALARHLRTRDAGAASVAVQWRRADDSVADVALALLPQRGGAGKFAGWVALVSTLPERPASDRERIGNLPLKNIIGVGVNSFCVVNGAGRLVLWNTRLELTTRRAAAELDNMKAVDLFGPLDRAHIADAMQDAFRDGHPVQLEVTLMVKDGHETPYLLAANRVPCGSDFYLFCMGIDVSNLRKAEQTSRLRERALHATSNGILITRWTGADNLIEYVNPAYEHITGFTAAEVLGRDPRFMAAPGVDEAARTELRKAIRDCREINVVFRNLCKDGNLFWNDLTVTPISDEDGKVTHFIGVINDVTALKQRTTHLEHEVNHDFLTGLANRNLLWDRIDQALHVAQRNKTLVATILIDLNRFKLINDTLGHEAGDEVLRVVARRLQAAVRDSDTVARLSGDEFVLVLTNQPSLRFTLRMVARLRASIAEPISFDSKEIAVGASIGVSIYPHDGINGFELVRAADAAMYKAKAAGGEEVHFFSVDMKATTEAKNKLESELRMALDQGQIFVLYLPRYAADSGTLTGLEALVRWRHPERGILLPATFLGEAEENGLIVPLGERVLDHVCRALRQLAALGHGALPISMNISYREALQEHYLSGVARTLQEAGLASAPLELEMREDYLMRNPPFSRELAAESKARGIGLGIDDFGAGACDLGYLQDASIKHIKMSRSLLRDLEPGTRAAALVKTVINIARTMELPCIADGVETTPQRDFLQANGCSQMQGYALGAPVAVDALAGLFAAA
jgi:diguanylate cyclase (GGDEF)-like protein/PAS domain S-box-containing protein